MKTFQSGYYLLTSCVILLSTVVLSSAATVLIPTNAVWKYYASSSDPGAGWAESGFNDSAWPSGAAKLGYGDGDEATVISSGDLGARYVTAYFRRAFSVPGSISYAISNATLRLRRDDGAVVYINGVEVRRDNMPAGPISYSTLATVSVGGAEEFNFFESAIPDSVWTSGVNVIAVEVHQVNVSSSDLGFALEITANLGPANPVVNVFAIDREAREIPPWLDIPENPAVFQFTRSGNTNSALGIAVRWSGTASNGVDYSFLSNSVIIPAGSRSTEVYVEAIDDNLSEGTESVIATILPVPCIECYWPGSNATATAHIIDNESTNRPPTVAISTPADGAKFEAPGNITIVANAQDPDGYETIVAVEFFANGVSLGIRTNYPVAGPIGPFVLAWNNVPVGAYALTAVAIDDNAATGTSAPVNITVVSGTTNTPPSITFWSPTNGAIYPGSTNIELRASAFDAEDGNAVSVDFFQGDQFLGSGTFVPTLCPSPFCPYFAFTWSNVPPGSYTLTARARDSAGAISNSPLVHVTVLGSTDRTVVSVVASDSQAGESGPLAFINAGTFTIRRSGNLSNAIPVYFTLGGTASNGVDYVRVSNSVVVAAGATQAVVNIVPLEDGLTEGTETVVLTLQPIACVAVFPTPPECYFIGAPSQATVFIADSPGSSNRPPVAQWVAPTNGASFVQGTNIPLRAIATDSDGSIARVEFRTGTTLLANVTTGVGSNYTYMWSNAPAGTFSLRAVAVDNFGARGTSAPVNITVVSLPTNAPPSVVIIDPTNGASFMASSNVHIEAVTTDPDGYANRASFFADGKPIGEAEILFIQPPADGDPIHLEFTWTNPPAGPHVLTVVATDDAGARGSSAPVVITVQDWPATNRELHAVGLYSGNYNGGVSPNHERGESTVIVNRPGQRISLFLSAYEPVLWHVQAASNTVIEKVILGGYYRQEVDGIGADVPVIRRYYEGGSYDYLWIGTSIDSVQFQRTLTKLCDWLGVGLASFQGEYGPPVDPFVIDAVDSDVRLRCDYPQPVDPATLPSLSFQVSFFTPGTLGSVYARSYTLAGPVGGGRLLPGMRVVADAGGRFYYGVESHSVRRIDTQNNTSMEMSLGDSVPVLSWPTGIGFDSRRNVVLLSSLGGEGYLYGYSPTQEQWRVIHSLDNRDVSGIGYHAANDSIYAVNTTYEDYGPRVVFRLNTDGELVGQIPLPPMPFNFGFSGYETELVSVGEYLVLLIEPNYQWFSSTSPQESRIYLIDPRTSEVWLTYRHSLSSPEADTDHDGVPDATDRCPGTASGAIVNAFGCSIAQLCRCDARWTNRAAYVQCVIQTSEEFLVAGLITTDQRNTITNTAAHSFCGWREPRVIIPPQPTDACTVIIDTGDATRWILECSTNLVNWTAIQTNTSIGTDIPVSDPEARTSATRFYRVKTD